MVSKQDTLKMNSIPSYGIRSPGLYRWQMLDNRTQMVRRYDYSRLIFFVTNFSFKFLITTTTNLDVLDDKNSIFGHVSEGMDTIHQINEAYCDKEGVPYQAIRILRAVVLDDPFDDPPNLVVPDAPPKREMPEIMKNRIRDDEVIDNGPKDDQATEELEKLQAEAEAKSRAEVLEMIGDLPVADVKPPDNVLFVCKLNPITESEDLELIFSRFGEIVRYNIPTTPFTPNLTSNTILSYTFSLSH